jgi:type IV pilus assembly protein PilZ
MSLGSKAEKMGDGEKEKTKFDSSPPPPSAGNRRIHDRFDVMWSVDLYASIANISEMGIFVRTLDPVPRGTRLVLSFSPPGHEAFKLDGVVAWINPVRANGDNLNPGMGVRFIELKLDDRERLVEVIRTIAYVREPS